MHSLGADVVWAIDVSRSMGRPHGDLRPSKLEAARELVALASSRIIDTPGCRVGIVGFHDRAFPLLAATTSYRSVVETLALLRAVGEGSSGGDGIIEAVKMLRGSGRSKSVIVVSDGGFNMGVPIPLASIYARNSGVPIHFVVIGPQPGDALKHIMGEAVRMAGGSIAHVESMEQVPGTAIEVVKSVIAQSR